MRKDGTMRKDQQERHHPGGRDDTDIEGSR